MRPVLGLVVAAVLAAGVITAVLQGTEGRATTPSAARPADALPAAGTPTQDPDISGAVQAPMPGVYRYHSTDANRPELAEQITVLDPKSNIDQLITAPTGVTELLEYTPGAVFELRYAQSGTSVADEVRCGDQTPIVRWQLPFAQHRSWESTARCTNLLGQQVTVHRQTTVVGPTSQTVAGASVPVWELVTITAQQSPKSSTSTTMTEDISATRGLVVRRVNQDGSNPKTLRTDTIVSLTPSTP